jgi:hypothetical protein
MSISITEGLVKDGNVGLDFQQRRYQRLASLFCSLQLHARLAKNQDLVSHDLGLLKVL